MRVTVSDGVVLDDGPADAIELVMRMLENDPFPTTGLAPSISPLSFFF